MNDEELIARYQAEGDSRALDPLFSRHIDRVRAIVYPILLNDADADDVTQEVFRRVHKALAQFKRKSSFTTWLHRIAVNAAQNHIRSRRWDRQVEWNEENPLQQVVSDKTPSDGLIAGETLTAVEKALRQLSPVLRTALVLTIMEGKEVSEAAKIQGCLVATMYWRVHQARKQMTRLLHEYQTR
jgi:RNA polymerase sigma-70 factor (ECF subfamily)